MKRIYWNCISISLPFQHSDVMHECLWMDKKRGIFTLSEYVCVCCSFPRVYGIHSWNYVRRGNSSSCFMALHVVWEKFFLPKKFLCFWWIKFFNYFTMAWWFFILKNIQTMQLNHQSAGKNIIKEEKESWTYMMRIQLDRIPSSERGKNQFLFLPAPHNSSYSLLLLLLFFYNFFSLFLHQRTVQL